MNVNDSSYYVMKCEVYKMLNDNWEPNYTYRFSVKFLECLKSQFRK